MGKEEALFHNSRCDSHPTPLANAALAMLFEENLTRLKVLEGK
jgi:hypothetical protein